MGGDGGGALILEMREVSKAFGPVQALDQVSLAVRAGSVHALIGENGAGKSTLMKILAGIHRPDAGELVINGKARRFRRPSQALAAGVAMIYQELSLAPELTVAENVFLGIEPRGALPGTVSQRRLIEETAALSAEHHFRVGPTMQVGELSTADCQIVEILKALARRASILVMDEPTSSLGRDEAAALLEVVRGLRERGVTVIYITHRLEEVEAIADDVTVLRDGRTVHSGGAAELTVQEIVRHMVGRDLTEYYPPRSVEIGDVRLAVAGVSTAKGVDDVSFEVRAGEVVGLAGLVGAGRTALADALFGVEPLTKGEVVWDGVPLWLRSPADALAAGFLYLTEDRKRTGLCLELPAGWNVTLPCLPQMGMGTFLDLGKEQRRVESAVQQLALRWLEPQTPASALSGGNQQKLLFARALLADSQMLILDEPTRGIDVGAKADIYRILGRFAAEGKAVLFISSELPELLGVTDRLLVMRRGRLVGELKTAQATQEAVMELAAVDAAGKRRSRA